MYAVNFRQLVEYCIIEIFSYNFPFSPESKTLSLLIQSKKAVVIFATQRFRPRRGLEMYWLEPTYGLFLIVDKQLMSNADIILMPISGKIK